jgi:hypothetical protein
MSCTYLLWLSFDHPLPFDKYTFFQSKYVAGACISVYPLNFVKGKLQFQDLILVACGNNFKVLNKCVILGL